MSRRFIALAAMLALAACANSAQSLAEGERMNWSCAGDKGFSLRYAAGGAEIYASGQTYTLPRASEPRRYSNGTVDYVEGPGGASLTGVHNGPFENCTRVSGAGDRSWWRFW